jgi:uncharacterized protein (DUF2267 family)
MKTTMERETFDGTIQKTNIWLAELTGLLGTDDLHRAFVALRAGLHALRDRLSAVEAAQLGAQLPMLVRGLYYEGWTPTGKPLRVRHVADFLDLVRRDLPPGGRTDLDAERVARAVFRVLAKHVSPGETRSIQHGLPRPLAELWPPPMPLEDGG